MNKPFTMARTLITPFIFLFLLVSCGGSGSDSNQANTDVTQLNGVWNGTLHSDSTSTDYDITGLIYDGEVRFVSTLANSVYVGTGTVSDASFSMSTTAYPLDGSASETYAINGSFNNKTALTGSYTSGTSDSGTLSLTYDTIYDRPSSLDLTQGIWSKSDSASTTTVTIDLDGVITGGNTYGCAYDGYVSIIDPSKNIYDANVTVANCDAYNGDYTGFAVLSDTTTTNDTFSLVLHQNNYVIFTRLFRQS